MGLIKIFSGNEKLAIDLQSKIEAIEVKTVVKSNNQASKMNNNNPILEVFIHEIDFGKANNVIENFRLNI